MLLSAKSRKTVGKVSDIAEIAESLGMDNENSAKQSVEQNFHAMSKAWRKQVNFLNTQVVSNCEITHLQNECGTLERCMLDLTQAYEVLESVVESPVERIALYGKFEDMSGENMSNMCTKLRDLRADREDKSSILSRRTNRSVVSRKPAKSTLSRSSKASTSSSTRQRRQDLEEEAAILKAKIRLAQEKEQLDQANR